jgi:L-galactose dehydrogenase
MDFFDFGSTGLKVSVAGLGCGGHSRLGITQGSTTEEAVEIVKLALDLGINYIDTAAAYQTEEIVGSAIEGHRDEVVLSTKVLTYVNPSANDGNFTTAAQLRDTVHESLRKLRTDYIDVVHLHGPLPPQYAYCVSELVPELVRLREEGKVGYLAISEKFGADPGHSMLASALDDEIFDVMLVGFNFLNQSAGERVMIPGVKKGVGMTLMYAVRNSLRSPEELRREIQGLLDGGYLDADWPTLKRELGFLLDPGEGTSIVDAAYRFARHEAGEKVVLTGTGNPEHLKANVASINRGPLPGAERETLVSLFGLLEHLTAG